MPKPVILCVDDEKIVLVGLKEQLKRHFATDYRFETVESGEEALELIDELTEDGHDLPLVISDHIMPGMKGTELLVAIHQRQPKTLTVLLTGQADVDAVGHAVNSGNLYRYISKPWSEDDLVMTIREATRRYYQDVELANERATLARLVAGIVHEVNTPLAAIRSSADILARAVAKLQADLAQSADPPKSARSLLHSASLFKSLEAGTERIGTLITHLSGFVNLDEADRRNIAVTDMLDSAVALLDPVLARIEVTKTYPDDGEIHVLGYAKQLSQVFVNLLENAAAAIDGEGSIAVRVAADEGHVRIDIIDDGRGIPVDLLPRIFEPKLSAKKGRVGLGIGLAICKRTIEHHGGQLGIDSTVGGGTSVVVKLPRSAS